MGGRLELGWEGRRPGSWVLGLDVYSRYREGGSRGLELVFVMRWGFWGDF